MSVYYADDSITLHLGRAQDVAKDLETGSVQTIVTSPPYFGLRDYGEDDQIGLEASPAEYVAAVVSVFEALRDALADDGTLWLNLGDSYYSGRGNPGKGDVDPKNSARRGWSRPLDKPGQPWARPKNLLGMPWRVAFALQEAGWILRSDIIWSKPNATPESVQDRPTGVHEHLFLFAKRPRYFYDAAAIAEASVGDQSERALTFNRASKEAHVPGQSTAQHRLGRSGPKGDSSMRNKRDVWSVPTVPFSEAHFATYPPNLIRPCILAGSRPGDVVLDPFSGSGTTGMVATEEGRRYVGIDVSEEYLDLSLRTRFLSPVLNFAGLGGEAS